MKSYSKPEILLSKYFLGDVMTLSNETLGVNEENDPFDDGLI